MSGKDANKNQKLTREHDFVFKASTHEEAAKWWDEISKASGIKTAELPAPTRENSLAAPPPPYVEKDKENLRLDTHAREDEAEMEAGAVAGGSVVQSPVPQTPVAPPK